MGRIEGEPSWVRGPGLADGFVGRESFEGLQPSAEVAGGDEVGQVASELVVRLVVEAPDGGVLEHASHAFDLAVGPRMARLGQAMVDVVLRAGLLGGVREELLVIIHGAADLFCGRADVAGRGEVRAVVGQHGMDPGGHGLDERAQDVTCDPARGFLVKFGIGARRRPGSLGREARLWISMEYGL